MKYIQHLAFLALVHGTCEAQGTMNKPEERNGKDAGNTVTAVLNGLEVTLDKRTGAMRHLYYPGVGTLLDADPAEAGLVDLAYPIKEFEPLRLSARFSSDVKIVMDPGRVVVQIPKLGASRGCFPLTGEVSATITLKADADGRSVIMSCELENKTARDVKQVIFPDFRGLVAVAGPEHTILKSCEGRMLPFKELRQSGNEECYYMPRSICEFNHQRDSDHILGRWTDLSGLNGGFSLFPRRWGRDRHIPTRLDLCQSTSKLRMQLVNPQEDTIAPGARWTSPEWVLTPHRSGWAKGIEPYRNWVASHMKRKYPVPKHIREGLGFRSIWMTLGYPEDPENVVWRFSDFAKLAKECLEHGLTEIVPWAWTDSFNPLNIRPLPCIGSEQEMIAAVSACKREGVNVAMFLSVIQIKKDAAARYGMEITDNKGWTYHPELIPRFNPYYASGYASRAVDIANPTYQDDVAESLQRWADKGITSWVWDQYWTREGDHMQNLTRRIRDYMRQLDPESSFAGEELFSVDIDCEWLDYTWNWYSMIPVQDKQGFTNAFPSPRLNININRNPDKARYAFMDNLFLNVWPGKPDGINGSDLIENVPELSRTLKICAGLRKQFLPYFTDGTLIGNCLMPEDNSTLRLSAYVLPDRLMAIVLNETPEDRKLDFRYDLSHWIQGNAFTLVRHDERGNTISTTNVPAAGILTTQKLSQYEMEIFEFKPVK